jgi:uncharacterized protein YjbI with pentapeptide repeats
MANEDHVALAKQGHKTVNQARKREPGLKLDLSGISLHGLDLSCMDLSHVNFRNTTLTNCKMRNAKLVGADLSGARLDDADLTGANLSSANFDGSALTQADLTDATVSKKTILKCDLQRAIFSANILLQANIAGANLSNHDLADIDLSGRDLQHTRFQHARLSGTKLLGSNLTGADFSSSALDNANFTNANLTQASLSHANLSMAILVGASLYRANLQQANLTEADVTDADFCEAILQDSIFDGVIGTFRARNLRTSNVERDVRYFANVVREWPERWFDWERIRIAGRLPLFGVSYSALILIPAYIYALEIYNRWVNAAKAWAEGPSLPASASKTILAHLHEEPTPSKWGLLLASTFLLAIASTIYTLRCPSRVKSFSRDEWCDEHGHSLVHYWADAWKWRPLRLLCAAMYLLGGLGAGGVLALKVWNAAVILYHSPSAFF